MSDLLQHTRAAETAVKAFLDEPTHTQAQRDLAADIGDKLSDLDAALLAADLNGQSAAASPAADALLNQLVALNALAKNDPAFANIVTVINRLTEK